MDANSNLCVHLHRVCCRSLVVAVAAAIYLFVGAELHAAQLASSFSTKEFAETKKKYYFKGKLNASGPPGTKPANGQWPVEDLPANPDKDWKMTVSFTGDGIETVQKDNKDWIVVRNAGVLLNPVEKGLHISVPDGEEHDGENPNNELPILRPKSLFDLSTDDKHPTDNFVKEKTSTNFGGTPHGDHIDYYGFTADLHLLTIGGTTTLQAKELRVFAKHDGEGYKDDFEKWTEDKKYTVKTDEEFQLGSKDSGNDSSDNVQPKPTPGQKPRSLAFDADSRTVTIAPATINVLSRGDGSRGTDPEFANDPLVHAVMQVSPLEVLTGPDGAFSLSGGELRIDNSDTGVHISAQFDDISLSDGGPAGNDYFGLLSSGSINYLPQEQPSFLSGMVDALVIPEGIDSDYTPLGLFLNPALSLIEATDGFTRSVVMPLAMSLSGLGRGPELPGDFDFDGDVDRDDLLVWQDGYGVSTDGDDLLDWQANFGTHSDGSLQLDDSLGGVDRLGLESGIVHGVPEPSTIMLGMVALTLAVTRRR